MNLNLIIIEFVCLELLIYMQRNRRVCKKKLIKF